MCNTNLTRVTLTLEQQDVDLIDRLAALEGANRSAEFRGLLEQLRPAIQQTVEALEAAQDVRKRLDAEVGSAAIGELAAIVPEMEALQDMYLQIMSKLQAEAAAATAPTFPPLDVTDWTTDEIDQQIEADLWADEAWKDRTGLDGTEQDDPCSCNHGGQN